MENENQNKNNLDSKKNGYEAQNEKEQEIRKINVHDGRWITERGGSNDEPSETPTERPHS